MLFNPALHACHASPTQIEVGGFPTWRWGERHSIQLYTLAAQFRIMNIWCWTSTFRLSKCSIYFGTSCASLRTASSVQKDTHNMTQCVIVYIEFHRAWSWYSFVLGKQKRIFRQHLPSRSLNHVSCKREVLVNATNVPTYCFLLWRTSDWTKPVACKHSMNRRKSMNK